MQQSARELRQKDLKSDTRLTTRCSGRQVSGVGSGIRVASRASRRRRRGAVSRPPPPLAPCHCYTWPQLCARRTGRQPAAAGRGLSSLCTLFQCRAKNVTLFEHGRPFWKSQSIVFQILLTDFAD